jgi:hypothetical protein
MKFLSPTLWLALAAPLMVSACATIAPPQPPSLELPKAPIDLRASRKGNRVVLTWTIPTLTTDRQTIRALGPTHICRILASALTQCGTPVGEAAALDPPTADTSLPNPTKPIAAKTAKQKPATTYTDTLPKEMLSDAASASATYAVEVLNREGRAAGLSNQVHIPLIHTPPAPLNFQANVTSQGVTLTWTGEPAPQSSSVHYAYRVYRRVQGEKPWTLVGSTALSNDPAYSLTDSDIEWEKTYEYRAEAMTLLDRSSQPGIRQAKGQKELQIEGDDTPEIAILAHDTFPPAVPSGLQAVFSGPGQKPFVDLVWAPVADVDLAGYNIYRHAEGGQPTRINAEIVRTPAYRDPTAQPGKYVYSVTSVDLRGNESARS